MSHPVDLSDHDPAAEPGREPPDPSAKGKSSAKEDPSSEASAKEEDAPFPWEVEVADDPDAPRARHDGFTEARKTEFLKALVKTGCITAAARRIGISTRTVYRHQEADGVFFNHCVLALRMSATPLEITAWQRAVDGVEERFAAGGEVHVRRRYDGSLLRLLLQGSNPKKYGPRPGFKRKRVLKHERKEMEREIRAQIEAERRERNRNVPPERTLDDAIKSILGKIEAIERHEEPKKFAAGWTKSTDGHWVPPGYGLVPGAASPDAAQGEGNPRISM